MTIPSTTRKAGPLLGDGSQTAWPFTFKVFSTSDVAVTIANALGVETTLVLDTDYSVSLNANQNTSPGGTVTYPISGAALPSGSVLTIAGDVDYDQALAVPTGGNFNPTTMERQLDRMVMQIQQLREQINRAIRVGVTSDADATLPAPAANNIIGWDSTANALENFPLTELATSIAFATYRYDTFDGDGVEDTFALSANPVTLGNIDVSVDGITYVPGVDHTLVGTSLVFTTPPPDGAEILARYGQGMGSGYAGDALDIAYQPAGGTVRTVQDKLREVISVKDFGATGDGTTDDTAEIQAAVTQAGVEGGVVFVPSGTYISTTIDIPSNVAIYGEGPGISIIKRKAAHTAPILRALGVEATRLENISISDLTVEGLETFGTADVSQATGHGIWIAYADNVLIENVRSTGHNHNGIHLTSVSKSLVKNCEADTNWIGIYWSGYWNGVTAILSEKCEVSHCRIHSNANDAFDFDFGVDGGSITGCHLYANDADADGDGGAIVVASDLLAFPCRNITVSNNHVLDAPISFAGTQGFVCTGNFVANTAHNTTAGQTQFGHGIEVFRKTGQAACIDGVITGNEVVNTGKHGIAVINWTASGTQDDILIADNLIKNCGSTTANTNDAIYVDAYSRKVVLSNNRIVCAVAGRTRYAVNLVSGATGALLGGVFDAGTTGTINNAATGFAVRFTPEGAPREQILTDLYIGDDAATARDVFLKGSNGARLRMQYSTAFGVDIGATDNSGSGTLRGYNGSWLEMLAWDLNRNVQAGGGAVATNATNGFFYVPTCAGTPTGVPTTKTGFAPIVVNTTNNKLYFYSGGAWRDAGP